MEKLFKLLSDAQASLFVLFHKTWAYHWNVVGEDFPQLHTLFGGQYEAMFEEIDRLSEHMRFLNIKPLNSLERVVEVSKIKTGQSTTDCHKMVKDLLKSNQDLCDLFTEVADEADAQKSRATSNLADDLNETHGKFVWMLRSYLETSPGLAKEEVEEEPEIIEETEEEIVEESTEEVIEETTED
jgi:starvation-inducible DNA-binding protein